MRIAGRRSDGALHLALGGGLSVVLLGDKASPPSDEAAATKMGPWYQADDSLGARTTYAKRLDRARVVTLYSLSMSFDERRERVCAALRKQLGLPSGYAGYGSGPYPVGMDLWIPNNGMGDDWVVYCINGRNYGMSYDIDDQGTVTFGEMPVEVHQTWESLDDSDTFGSGAGEDLALGDKIELKKTMWFRRYMASKKKLTDMPGSLPNLSAGKALTDMPGSIPNAGSKEVG